jgi:hypothetical protein
MAPGKWKGPLFVVLLVLLAAGSYPLAWAFFEQPITVAVGWHLAAGLVMALYFPAWSSASPIRAGRRGSGSVVAIAAAGSLALEVVLGYYVGTGLGAAIDTSTLRKDPFWEEGWYRAVTVLLAAYLAGSLAFYQIGKGFKTGGGLRVAVATIALSLVVGLLFHFLIYRIRVEKCYIAENAGKSRYFQDLENKRKESDWQLVALDGNFSVVENTVPELYGADGERFAMLAQAFPQSGVWLIFEVPPQVVAAGGLSFHLRGFPSVALPQRLEKRAADRF